jgi:tetratricopeptide (TPR) repeat protein/ubiquinone/menaquinone biosynthesis C-methylase UbiE
MAINSDQKGALRSQGLLLMSGRRLEEAKAVFTEISRLDPEDAETWYMLSSINGMLGNIAEAGGCCRRVLSLQPDNAEAHVILGNVLASQGQFDAAAAAYEKAIELNRDLPIAYFNLGNLQLRQERYDKAADNYCRAMQLNPVPAQTEAVRKKAQILMQRHRFEEAAQVFAHLCQVNPRDAEAWYDLSNAQGNLGKVDEAGECCRRVLEIQPDHSGAHTNLGNVLFHRREFGEAVGHYLKALAQDPHNIVALHNLGRVCQSDEDIARYIEHYRRVINSLPDSAAARAAFSEVMDYTFVFPAEYMPWLDEELQQCYAADGINYQLLGPVTARLLKLKYHIQPPADDDETYVENMSGRITSDGLFLMMMEKSVNKDADIELLLIKVRRRLLLNYRRERSLSPDAVKLALALAYQGINNEHVFSVDAEEEAHVADMRREIEENVPSLDAPGNALEEMLLIFGMYEDLSSLTCREHLSRLPPAEWSEAFRAFLTEALLNPLEEQRIKEKIVSLGEIADRTSQLVQSQYEENPYPRWVVTSRKGKENIRQKLQATFPHFTPPAFVDGPIRMLAAGCGTGMQAIQAALGYRDVEIVAVDISNSSLAYAARMARKYGVENIEFMQGDILDLAGLDRRFHVIECIGVLHHMEDPLAGWRVLAGLLVEGGLMQIGLYSEAARKVVVEARDIIRNEGLASDKNAIRDFRARVLRREWGDDLYQMSRNSPDFYSVSSCRDLLFHYQEHRYTLPQLRRELDELKLNFIGFKGFRNANTAGLYRSQFPQDTNMNNLELWERFEELYPNTFGEMYHFWCQRTQAGA